MKRFIRVSAISTFVTAALVGCTLTPSTDDRDAAAFIKDVRVCVSQDSDVIFEIAPVKWTKGPAKTASSKGALGCYENDNDKARTGIYFLFDTETVTLFGRNSFMAQPDVVLCQTTLTVDENSPDCADKAYTPQDRGSNIFGLNTFGENVSHTMDALGHFFQVTRVPNEGSFVVYNVVVKK